MIADQSAQGRTAEDAQRRADDPDYYQDAFFVPASTRWPELNNNLHNQIGDGSGSDGTSCAAGLFDDPRIKLFGGAT